MLLTTISSLLQQKCNKLSTSEVVGATLLAKGTFSPNFKVLSSTFHMSSKIKEIKVYFRKVEFLKNRENQTILSYFFSDECDMCFPLPTILNRQISCGQTLYCIMYYPPNMDIKRKYPVILNIYGGPDFQLVTNTFKVRIVSSVASFSKMTDMLCILHILANGRDERIGIWRYSQF